MMRKIVIAGLGAILLGCIPAHAQDVPELDGAPPPLKVPSSQPAKPPPVQPKVVKPAPKPAAKPAQTAADKAKADAAKIAQQAEAQKIEQARLAKQAADLKARQASLDARAAELAAEEKRLAELRAQQEAQLAAQQAALVREREEVARKAAEASKQQAQVAEREDDDDPTYAGRGRSAMKPGVRGFSPVGLDRNLARRSCVQAGEEAARDRNFHAAEYDSAPTFYQGRRWELRGLMRLEDRRGYMIVDTVCEVDADGEVQRFAFLR